MPVNVRIKRDVRKKKKQPVKLEAHNSGGVKIKSRKTYNVLRFQ